jgi:biopolymer transport protein ExbB/TolQ
VVVGGLALLAMLLRAWFVMRLGAARARLARRLAPILSLAEGDSEAGRAALQERLDHAFLAESPRLERFGTLITVLAAIAPLLGLLGTVMGMIETFDSLGDMTFYSQSGGIAAGIATALFTTQFGLVVAVPGVIAKSLLDRRQFQIENDLASIKDILLSGGSEASA